VSLETDFSAALLAQCPRVTPGTSALNSQRPFVTWDHIGGDPLRYMDGSAGAQVLALLQVRSWASTRAEALAMARQIEDAVCTAARLSARPIGLPFCDVEDAVEPPLHYAQQEFEVLGDR